MFLDSLVGDSAWRAVYARDGDDEPIPFDLLKKEIELSHPFAVFLLRGMLAVSYFEKALYELPEEEITAERVKELADTIEMDIQGGLGLRPILAVSARQPSFVRLLSCACDYARVHILHQKYLRYFLPSEKVPPYYQ